MSYATARNLRRKRQAARRRAVIDSTRELGCRCAVDIVRRGPDHFRAAHDPGCPVEHLGPVLIALDDDPAGGCDR